MSASTKLSTAVKALCQLASAHPAAMNSAEISLATGLNASKIRRVLSMLARADIVRSERGLSGGFTLRKHPAELHLQEIYCAIEDRKAFHLDVRSAESAESVHASNINRYMLDLFADIQVDIEDKMRSITLHSILTSLH